MFDLDFFKKNQHIYLVCFFSVAFRVLSLWRIQIVSFVLGRILLEVSSVPSADNLVIISRLISSQANLLVPQNKISYIFPLYLKFVWWQTIIMSTTITTNKAGWRFLFIDFAVDSIRTISVRCPHICKEPLMYTVMRLTCQWQSEFLFTTSQ